MTPGVTSATASGMRKQGATRKSSNKEFKEYESTTQKDYVAIGLEGYSLVYLTFQARQYLRGKF